MSGILAVLEGLGKLGIGLPEILALLAKYEPLIERLAPIAKSVIELAIVLKNAFGHSVVDSLSHAIDIKLGFRLPTPAEEKVMFDRGMLPADQNHDFPQTLG